MDEPTSGGTAPGERGYRRMRLAAMAGNLYRSGQQAVSGMKEQYAQTMGPVEGGGDGHGRTSIPGAFPDVEIHVQGHQQMVLFPSYAIRHIKRDWDRFEQMLSSQHDANGSMGAAAGDESAAKDGVYWRQEWERHEDEKAVVDVDVRGWIYSPQLGPVTRRNRMLIGLARQLSGIPPPRNDTPASNSEGGGSEPAPDSLRAHHQMHEAQREQERIEREAAQIERRGREEERVAFRGGYSERPRPGPDAASRATTRSEPNSAPVSPTQSALAYGGPQPNEMSEAELAIANANLMARIAPFMTTPLVSMPVTVFFYNETRSRSRTIMTNDAGHFNLRAALDFVPTHVKVLTNESLSAINKVAITEPKGISLISDVDDTIKRSNISGGAKEIFRNTFVRDLKDLMVDGVAGWYNEMHRMGVSIHYCSNSPWQLYPVLSTFFKAVGLPPGSLHLKQYSGMLQGIFEPVAERKKSTLDRLLRDFPQRKFILVGDSGEADLEVYTELALANPGRILAVFIRDVTTTEQAGFFDNSFGASSTSALPRRQSGPPPNDGRNRSGTPRQQTSPRLGARQQEKPRQNSGPVMGDLIDLSEPATVTSHSDSKPAGSANGRKLPPPRPAKPAALRSAPSLVGLGQQQQQQQRQRQRGPASVPPLPARKPLPPSRTTSSTGAEAGADSPPPPPPPRRRSFWNSNADVDEQPLPPPAVGTASAAYSRSRPEPRTNKWSPAASPDSSPTLGPQVPRKVELWTRRLSRAHEQLDHLGVLLYTWRTGGDVVEEAVGIVEQAKRKMGM